MADDRHDTESSLREGDKILALAAGSTGIGIYDCNMVTGEVHATGQILCILGLRPEAAGAAAADLLHKLTYSAWAACVHPGDLPRVQSEIDRSMAGHEPFYSEYRVIWPDGISRWVAWRGIFQYDHEGRANRLLGTLMDITDQKRTEIALRQSEDRLWGALVAGRVITFEWNAKSDAVIRSWNAAQVLGFDPARGSGVSGQDYLRHIHDDDRADLIRLTRGLSPESFEYKTKYRFVRDDGRVIWLEESASAEFDEDRTLAVVRGIVTDVTDRVAALERERHQAAIASVIQSEVSTANAMEEGVVLLQLDGTIISVNHTVERLTGMIVEQFAGKDLRQVMPRFLSGEDMAMLKEGLAELAEGRIPKMKEIMFRHGAGRTLWLSPSIALIDLAAETPVSAVLRLNDVTELRRSGELLARLFDESHQEIAHFDKDFTIVGVNRAYAKSHGHPSDFFSGMRYFELYPQPEKERLFRQVWDTGERFVANEMAFMHPEDQGLGTRYCDCSILPVKDERGEVEGLLLCLIDATERVLTRRKLAEEEQRYVQKLRALADRLAATEEDHRRRVAALIHDTVIQTMALSHIRLGGVIAAVEAAGLAEQRKKIDGVRELLHKGIAEARTLMEELVPSMLYEVGLAAALREFAEKASKLDGTPISVETDVRHEQLDEAQRGVVFQCARELIMNALKYAGRCEIKVLLTSVDRHLHLEVRDTGSGFDPGVLSSVNRHTGNGGFGLFNIRERLGSIGGRLEIASSPGKGTMARMAMPLKEGSQGPAAGTCADAIADTIAECDGNDMQTQTAFDFAGRQAQP